MAFSDDGEQNHVSKRTYCAGIPVALTSCNKLRTTAGASICASLRCFPPLLLASTDALASLSRFFSFEVERRQNVSGRNVFPSVQPRTSKRKPFV